MMFWTKFLNENMSIDEILSGMDSKGKPARIAMPLSSLKADSDGISAGQAQTERPGGIPLSSGQYGGG